MAEIRKDRYGAVIDEWKAIEERHALRFGLEAVNARQVQREKLKFLERAEATLGKPSSIEERLSFNELKKQRRQAENNLYPSRTPGRNWLGRLNDVVFLLRRITQPLRYSMLREEGITARQVMAVDLQHRIGGVKDVFIAAGMPSMATRLQNQYEQGIVPESLTRRTFTANDKILQTDFQLGKDAKGLPEVGSYTVSIKNIAGGIEQQQQFDAREVGVLADRVVVGAMAGAPFLATNAKGQQHWFRITDGATHMLDNNVDLNAAIKALPLKGINEQRLQQIRTSLEAGEQVDVTHRDGRAVKMALGNDLKLMFQVSEALEAVKELSPKEQVAITKQQIASVRSNLSIAFSRSTGKGAEQSIA